MADNFRHAQYREDGTQIDDPQRTRDSSILTRNSTISCPSRIFISAPISAAPTKTTAAVHTYDVQLPAKREFYGVQFVFENYDTSGVMAIALAKCASARRHLLDTGANIHAGGGWSSALTVGGSTSWNVPAATAASIANHFLRGISITDFYPLLPQTRTDSATYGSAPLVRCRSLNNGNAQYPYNVGSGLAPSWNGYSGNGGLLIGSYMTGASDYVTDPTVDGVSVLESGGYIASPAGIFYYTEPGYNMHFFGDSLIQGSGSDIGITASNGTLGFPLMLHCQNKLIDTANFAVTGEATVDSISTMQTVISALTEYPSEVALKVYSPNDGAPTTALTKAVWSRILNALVWLRVRGITPRLITSPPVNSWTSDQHAANEAQNSRAKALVAGNPWIKLTDMAAIVSDPANTRRLLPAYDYDGTHLLTPGYQAVADDIVASLKQENTISW